VNVPCNRDERAFCDVDKYNLLNSACPSVRLLLPEAISTGDADLSLLRSVSLSCSIVKRVLSSLHSDATVEFEFSDEGQEAFGCPEEEEQLPLKTATKQRLVKTVTE
jgi:hypothetical protein